LTRIKAELAADPNAAAFAVNQIIHPSNERLQHDMELCVKHEVPLVITSLSAPTQIVPPVHAYGGKVFHDVISVRHAEKALEAGVDGLILVCAGAGGHAGMLSPFALVGEIRKFYDGPIALSGSIANGSAILSAEAMGADFAYIGTRFIATTEANAQEAYKQCIVDSAAVDVVYTPYFTGVHGNYLKKSIVASGLDPANLPERDKTSMNFGAAAGAKAWKDIWGAGQGVGNINDVLPTVELVARMKQEYRAAKAAICSNPY
jgi:nitronate monooxygenase